MIEFAHHSAVGRALEGANGKRIDGRPVQVQVVSDNRGTHSPRPIPSKVMPKILEREARDNEARREKLARR
jgi:RNA recognition motif-containing protein